MKCRYIKIQNQETRKWDIIPVSSVFNLAVMDHTVSKSYYEYGFWGINIGVAVPLENEEEYNSFAKKYFRWQDEFCTVSQVMFYLLGEDGEKVPVRGKDGFAYNERFGGCCLFGWIAPDLVAEDEHPMPDKITVEK